MKLEFNELKIFRFLQNFRSVSQKKQFQNKYFVLFVNKSVRATAFD